MTSAPLLIELLTEELPPKALHTLGESFAAALAQGLRERGLAAADAAVTSFATPRRLAVLIGAVAGRAEDRVIELRGPSLKVALDDAGEPTKALIKWAEKQGVAIAELTRGNDGRQECFVARRVAPGAQLRQCIDELLGEALAKLPIPKLMQYQLADGQTSVSFVRPAHGLVVLHGSELIPATVLGIKSGRSTRGHRFQSPGAIVIEHATSYEATLREKGRVIASFETRRARIRQELLAAAAEAGAALGDEAPVAALLDEVSALVEWPAVYLGSFDHEFLAVPQECLILTMRTNQKYFPLFDAEGKLLASFLIVSNLELDDPALVIDGNERVVRPRLADARFFFEQDRRKPLAARVAALAEVVYHAKLGTQAERCARVGKIAVGIANALGVDSAPVARAALLAKTDLLTGMVGEFPELQGIMGAYYARHDGEPEAVASAIEEHYRPRFAGDALAATDTGLVLAMADKLETLAGLFAIGQLPSGDRDPFALRRHALGVIRMLIERELALPLDALLAGAFAAFPSAAPSALEELANFFYDRLNGYLKERGFSPQEIGAVIDSHPAILSEVLPRLDAVRSFLQLPEAEALAAANKRTSNILRKSADGAALALDPALLAEPAEIALAQCVATLAPRVDERLRIMDYAGALALMADARDDVDRFFEQVMVMAPQAEIRANRLALLRRVSELMNRVADISRLSNS